MYARCIITILFTPLRVLLKVLATVAVTLVALFTIELAAEMLVDAILTRIDTGREEAEMLRLT